MINIQFGTISGYRKGDYLNLENVQVLQVYIENDIDAFDALLINPAMDESAPKNGDRIAILKLGNFSIAIGGIDGIEPVTEQGEKRLYSRDENGAIAAFISLLASGIIELNGTGDFAVRFLELEKQIDILNTKYDSHTHTSGGSGSPTTPPLVSLGLDISAAKIEEIKVKAVTP